MHRSQHKVCAMLANCYRQLLYIRLALGCVLLVVYL